MYHCQYCQYQRYATDPCVFRHNIVRAPSEKFRDARTLAKDPTLPVTRLIKCPKCSHSEAAYFQLNSGRDSDKAMTVIFVCRNPSCQHKWEV